MLQIALQFVKAGVQCAQTLCYLRFNRGILDVPLGQRLLLLYLAAHCGDFVPDPIGNFSLHYALPLRMPKEPRKRRRVPDSGTWDDGPPNRCKSRIGTAGEVSKWRPSGYNMSAGSPATHRDLRMLSTQSFILVVVGLAFEARIARTSKGATVCCRRGGEAEAAMEQALDDPRCRGAISFGIAGGLDHKIPTGTHLVASEIVTPQGTIATDPRWSQRLIESSDSWLHARILGADRVIADPLEKRELFETTGAIAVDTESHITALMARERGLPFACLRIVADPAHRRVPEAALSGLHPDGRSNPLGVVRALARRPHDVPALLSIARDTWLARRSLTRAMALIGDDLGLPAHETAASAQVIEIVGDELLAAP